MATGRCASRWLRVLDKVCERSDVFRGPETAWQGEFAGSCGSFAVLDSDADLPFDLAPTVMSDLE